MKKSVLDYTKRFFYLILACCCSFLLGCEGEDETVAAYITINDFVVESTNPNQHGSISHKITNAFVFLVPKDSVQSPHQLGVVTLPATVPAIVSGEFEINIDPVVKANGSSFSLEVYPFYQRYKQNVTLVPDQEIEVSPRTSYRPEAKFRLIENFESSGHLFGADRDGNFATTLENSTEDVFEGNKSGRVFLDTANNVFVVANADLYEINFPEATRVYMEANYKTDIPLEFGILSVNTLGDETPAFEFVVLAKPEWNKIYFDMTNLLNSAPSNLFAFIIRGGLPFENGEFTLKEAEVYFDNIKVITF
ncbi:MAG: hypothetical protein AAFZ15_20715 [Bacteroidota bacterium]